MTEWQLFPLNAIPVQQMINALSLLNGKPPRLGRSVSEASVLEEKGLMYLNPPHGLVGWALSNSRIPQAKEPYLLGRKNK